MIIDPSIEFRPTNFQQNISLTDTFDLALSMEVAEHLPAEAADQVIQTITRSSNVVVFSAAFTGQPGAGHINTRPHSYWANKFMSYGYMLFDIFRPEFWSDERVEPWYRQNTFLYIKGEHPLHDALMAGGQRAQRDARFVDCVHPWLYLLTYNELTSRAGK